MSIVYLADNLADMGNSHLFAVGVHTFGNFFYGAGIDEVICPYGDGAGAGQHKLDGVLPRRDAA